MLRAYHIVRAPSAAPFSDHDLRQVAQGVVNFEECLKHDGTTSVYLLKHQQQAYVVKRFNTKGPWHFVRRFVQTSRAQNCFQMAQCYLSAGIATPEPVAFVQERITGLKLRSWYICAYERGSLLSDAVDANSSPDMKLHQAIVGLFSKLREYRLSHGDMKATNIIVQKAGWMVIDLDAAKQHKKTQSWYKAANKDWRRLLRNWPETSATHQAISTLHTSIFEQRKKF